MAANEGDSGPETDGPTGDRRPTSSQRRKPQPITIDLAASAVRIEGQPADAPKGEFEPFATEANAPVVEASEPVASQLDAKQIAVEPATDGVASDHISEQPASTAFADAEALGTAEEKIRDDKPAPAATPVRGDRTPLIASSLIGGAIGLIAAYGLAVVGLWPGQGNTAITAQMAALEARLATAEAKVGPNGQLATELDHLKSIPSIPGVTISDVEKILDPFTAKTAAAVAHMDEIDRKIAGEQAIVRGESKASQDAMTTRMTALDNSVSGAAATTNKLNDDVAKLHQDLAALDKKATDQLAAAHDDLSTTLQSLATRVNDLDTRTAAEFAVVRGGASKASDEIAKLGQSATDLATDTAAIHKALTDQMDSIARLQAQLQPIDDMRKAIDGLGARIGAVDDVKKILEQQTAKLNTADDAKKAADGVAASLWIIDQRMSNIQARLADVDALKASVAGDAKQLTALETRVAPVEAKVAGLDGYAKQGLDARKDAVSAVAIANLKSAAESGLPFANELAATKAVVGKSLDLSPLDIYAAKGLISDTKLIEGFDPAARRIADAAAPATSDDGILGTLLSHAAGSVKIMSSTAQPGDSIDARLSRINARLTAHDLGGALAEWQALPDAAQKASADWGNALKTHVDGAKAVAAISDQAMAKLTSASQ
jgi:hypothetical protein